VKSVMIIIILCGCMWVIRTCTCTCLYVYMYMYVVYKILNFLQYQFAWPVGRAASHTTLLLSADRVRKWPHLPPKFHPNIPSHLSVWGEYPFPPDHVGFLTTGPLACWKPASVATHRGATNSGFDTVWETDRLCEGTAGVCLFPPLPRLGE
jgi:hypothetical protein